MYSEEERQVAATRRLMIKALNFHMKNAQECCLNNELLEGHKSTTDNALIRNPEVFIFNLHWEIEPLPSEILKLLVTIPETFANTDIFDKVDKGPGEYIFKGMTCFQGAHYISFFRRLLMKFDYLYCNPETVNSDL